MNLERLLRTSGSFLFIGGIDPVFVGKLKLEVIVRSMDFKGNSTELLRGSTV